MIVSEFAFVVLGFFYLQEGELWKAKNIFKNKFQEKLLYHAVLLHMVLQNWQLGYVLGSGCCGVSYL